MIEMMSMALGLRDGEVGSPVGQGRGWISDVLIGGQRAVQMSCPGQHVNMHQALTLSCCAAVLGDEESGGQRASMGQTTLLTGQPKESVAQSAVGAPAVAQGASFCGSQRVDGIDHQQASPQSVALERWKDRELVREVEATVPPTDQSLERAQGSATLACASAANENPARSFCVGFLQLLLDGTGCALPEGDGDCSDHVLSLG